MRKAYLFLLLAPSAFVYACGGGDSTVDGGSDATNDTTTDTGKDASGNETGADASDAAKDGGGQDVTVSIQCLHPADCIDGGVPDAAYPPSSGEVCCATAVTTGNVPNCSLSSFTTVCSTPGSCPSNIPLSSTCGTDTVRGCQHASECVETNYDKCCTFNFGDASAQACVGATIANLLKATCLDAGQ